MMTTINLMGLRSREIRAFTWVVKFLSLSFSPDGRAINRNNTREVHGDAAREIRRYTAEFNDLKTPASSGIDGLELSSVARPGCFRRVGRVLLFDHTHFAPLLPYDPAFHVVSQLCTTAASRRFANTSSS